MPPIESVVSLFKTTKHDFADPASCVNATRFCVLHFPGTVPHEVLLVSPTSPLVIRGNLITPPCFPKLCVSIWKLHENGCVWQFDHAFDKLLPFVGSIHTVALVPNAQMPGKPAYIIDFALGQFQEPLPADLRLCLFESCQQPTEC